MPRASSTTCTPLHALTTLNDPTWVEAATALARRSMQASPDLDTWLTLAFRRVVCRKPTDQDLKTLRHAYRTQSAIYKTNIESARALVACGFCPARWFT